MVHVVVILSTITVYGLTDEWFMLLLLYCLPLLFKVWQRSGSCCCYIVYHYCLRFDRGVVHVILVGYIVYHYCLEFVRGVVHVVVAILCTITLNVLINNIKSIMLISTKWTFFPSKNYILNFDGISHCYISLVFIFKGHTNLLFCFFALNLFSKIVLEFIFGFSLIQIYRIISFLFW